MLKYIESMVVFSEIPDEVTLDINITNCPLRCPGCHSAYLQKDIGEYLTDRVLDELLEKNAGISCVLFSGGDSEHSDILRLCKRVKETHPELKTAMYSGMAQPDPILWNSGLLDYYKIGPWIQSLGPLDSPTTNQKLYKLTEKGYVDITKRFLEKKHTAV